MSEDAYETYEVINLPGDAVAFIGKVSEWMKSVPFADLSYGSYFVSTVEVVFDNEIVGKFRPDGIGPNTYEFVVVGSRRKVTGK